MLNQWAVIEDTPPSHRGDRGADSARHPARAFAVPERHRCAAGGPQARHPGRVRDARVLGGRRGRPRHDHGGQPALSRSRARWRPGRCGAPMRSRRSARDCARTSSRAGIPAERVTVIPNAVNPARLSADRAPDAGSGGAARAWAMRYARFHRLVLRLRGPRYAARGDAEGLSAGAGRAVAARRRRFEEDRLKAQAGALGLADRVVFAGRVPHHDVQRYYSLVDLSSIRGSRCA